MEHSLQHSLEHLFQATQFCRILGHPEFYPRFGFAPARPKGLECEYEVADETFMVAELTPGALQGVSGIAKYRPEFEGV